MDPEETDTGVKVTLTRIEAPKLYGMEPFNNVTVQVDFHADHRLRIKVLCFDFWLCVDLHVVLSFCALLFVQNKNKTKNNNKKQP